MHLMLQQALQTIHLISREFKQRYQPIFQITFRNCTMQKKRIKGKTLPKEFVSAKKQMLEMQPKEPEEGKVQSIIHHHQKIAEDIIIQMFQASNNMTTTITL